MAGSPVIQPKVGAVKAPELSPYYSSIYISGSLSACSLGFALPTRSSHKIYVTRWRLNVHLLGFSIFTVSHPLFTRSKQDCVVLMSLSPPSQLVKEASVSHRTGKGRRCSVNSIAFGEGGNPLPAVLFSFTQRLCGRATDPFFLAAVRSVGRSGLPPHALPHPDDPKV